MEEKEIREAYGIAAKRLDLPAFDDLDNEFEISNITNTRFILREVRRRICEKIEHFTKILEELIQPDTTLSNLHEVKDMTEEQKKRAYDLYRNLMGQYRQALLIGVDNNDDETAAFIRDFLVRWQATKKELRGILTMMRDSWKESRNTGETLEYFG